MRILLADDCPFDRRLARDWLRRERPGAEVVEVDSATRAICAMAGGRYDEVVTDLLFRTSGLQGSHVVDVARERGAVVTVLTGVPALAPSGVRVVDKGALLDVALAG